MEHFGLTNSITASTVDIAVEGTKELSDGLMELSEELDKRELDRAGVKEDERTGVRQDGSYSYVDVPNSWVDAATSRTLARIPEQIIINSSQYSVPF